MHICLANLDVSHQLGSAVSGAFSYAKLGAVKTFTRLKITV